MKNLFAPIVILILAVGMAMQGIYIEEAQQTTEDALEVAEKWLEAYRELQQDYSQAVELIEHLEYELRSESE